MTTLQVLAEARQEILKAEVVALLHNISKLDASFLLVQAVDRAEAQKRLKAAGKKFDSSYQMRRITQPPANILRRARVEITTLPRKKCQEVLRANYFSDDERTVLQECEEWLALPKEEQEKQPLSELAQLTWAKLSAALWFNRLYRGSGPVWPDEIENVLRNTSLNLLGESWPLDGFLSLFWDQFHYNRGEYERVDALGYWIDRTTNLLRGLILAHGSVSGAEKEPVNGEDEEQKGNRQKWPRQKYFEMKLATAFGHEGELVNSELLSAKRQNIGLSVFPIITSKVLQARDVVLGFSEDFQNAVGDTRRPINDVSLWDMSHPTATLFKAYLATSILKAGFVSTASAKWRLLHISFDGLAFWGRAHHVTDLLGRRKVLQDGLNAVRNLLEVQYPLGNEVYRDEHGSVFVVPDVVDLLKLEDEQGKRLKALLEEAFDAKDIRGELAPQIEVSCPYKGKEIDLAGVLQNRSRPHAPQPKAVANWWSERQHSKNDEICTVCGQRPVGYVEPGLETWVTPKKARDRNVCGVCLHRRGRRARDWAGNRKVEDEKLGSFQRTIWIDEVADDNGRFTLLVGRFILDGWLDGKLIPTMLKSSSFARIRRCWDTTRQFWLAVQNEIIPDQVGQRLRLGIRPANAEHLKGELGRWHTYEAEISGRRLGLCWHPNQSEADHPSEIETAGWNLFWTTDNLNYLAEQIGTTVETLQERIRGRKLPLYEPGGYLGQDRRAEVDAEACQLVDEATFYPFIPLMAEPATFMALVPADKALSVARAIKAKYGQEMARVRDRLPLHLGLVFAPRRTPLGAVLEAGRAMLTMPDKWEAWEIKTTNRRAHFSRNGQTIAWTYPAKMGDDKTCDIWYPHLLAVDPTNQPQLNPEAGHFRLVETSTGSVFIRPSRFDFEFLDTTAQRFEIHYPEGDRRERPTRPFLLDDLDRLEKLWRKMSYLEKSQCYQVISTIEAAREDWFGDDSDCQSWTDDVFRQFVHNTLAGAAWPEERRWYQIDKPLREQLIAAGITGELADLAELHLEILKE